MAVSRHSSFILGLLLLFVLVLPGCKSNKLENGVARTQISGSVETGREFRVTLPANADVLMVQTSASEQVLVNMLDANRNPLPTCELPTLCRQQSLPSGDYYVTLTGLGPFSNLSLVASWSGPDSATLKNSEPVTGLKGNTGTVILQSLHIPYHFGALTLQASATGSYSMEILDASGTVLHTCSNGASCSLSQQFNGNYFVRIIGLSDFDNLTVQASWGGASQATLSNGVAKKGLSGAEGTEHFESVYLPPGTQALMVQHSPTSIPVEMSILDENGSTLQHCGIYCVVNNPQPGMYYIRMFYHWDVSDLSVIAVWGGENESQLKNGVPLIVPEPTENDILITSLYLPENTHGLMLSANTSTHLELELIDQYGNSIWFGDNVSNLPIQNPPSGLYFLHMHPQHVNGPVKLIAAWGANEQGILQNNIAQTGISGEHTDILLTTLFVPENTQGLMLQTSLDAGVFLELINVNGEFIWAGDTSDISSIPNPQPGLYFVRIYLAFDATSFEVTAIWGANDQGILQNGVPLSLMIADVNDAVLLSLHIPEGTDSFMLQASMHPYVHLDLVDPNGHPVSNNWHENSHRIENPIAGLYFIRIRSFESTDSLKITAIWHMENEGSLQNGTPASGFGGKRHDVLLSSVHVPEGAQYLMLQSSIPSHVFLQLVDKDGDVVWGEDFGSNSPIHVPEPGLYFIRMHLYEDISAFTLTAAWASTSQGTLLNGVPLSMPGGDQNDILLSSVYVPEGVVAMMLQTGMDADVHLELIDQNGNFVWGGPGTYGSPIQYPEPGLYFVRIHLPENSSPFKLTAAWGSHQQGILQNGVPLTGLSGNQNDMLLSTVYVPEGVVALMLQTGVDADVHLELIDQNGNFVWGGPGTYGSPIQYPEPGLYFVRIHLPENSSPFKLTAAWGSHQQGILQNGVPLAGLSGNQNDMLLSTVYVPEGVVALMLQTGVDADVHLELIDQNGNFVWGGPGTYGSPIQYPEPGLYFVRIHLPENSSPFKLTAAWGSHQQGILQNGVPLTGLSGNQNDMLLSTVYVPEGVVALMLQTGVDADVHLELIDQNGNFVWGGPGTYGSPLQYPEPGLYFVRIHLMENGGPFKLTAAWGSHQQGILQNGVPLTGLSGNQNDMLLSTVYVPEGVVALMLQTGMDADVHLELIDQNGNFVWGGPGANSNPVPYPQPGLYFIRMHTLQDIDNFSLTGSW